MTDTTKPTEIDDADLDAAGGLSPDMTIKTASTSGLLDSERVMGVRKFGVRENGVRKNGVRLNGIREMGVRKKG